MSNTLIVPGLHGSGSGHWQTWFQIAMPDTLRVEQDDWNVADICTWSKRLERDLKSPAFVVVHSFGCLATVASAAASLKAKRYIRGALLVAPADPDKLEVSDCTVRTVLPFPSVVVASRNDPWMTFDRATYWAMAWGSRLIDAGCAGHINIESGHGRWPEALELFSSIVAEAEP